MDNSFDNTYSGAAFSWDEAPSDNVRRGPFHLGNEEETFTLFTQHSADYSKIDLIVVEGDKRIATGAVYPYLNDKAQAPSHKGKLKLAGGKEISVSCWKKDHPEQGEYFQVKRDHFTPLSAKSPF